MKGEAQIVLVKFMRFRSYLNSNLYELSKIVGAQKWVL